jgi:multidrug transporter EmrE-like cation transporter
LLAEGLGDVATKSGNPVLSILAYNVMIFAWFKTVQSANQNIAIPGVFWCIGGQAILVVLGATAFNEVISFRQWIGIGLSFVAVGFMVI